MRQPAIAAFRHACAVGVAGPIGERAGRLEQVRGGAMDRLLAMRVLMEVADRGSLSAAAVSPLTLEVYRRDGKGLSGPG